MSAVVKTKYRSSFSFSLMLRPSSHSGSSLPADSRLTLKPYSQVPHIATRSTASLYATSMLCPTFTNTYVHRYRKSRKLESSHHLGLLSKISCELLRNLRAFSSMHRHLLN